MKKLKMLGSKIDGHVVHESVGLDQIGGNEDEMKAIGGVLVYFAHVQ